MWWKKYVKKFLVWEKKLNYINFEKSKKGLLYIKNNLIDSNNNMYLTVDSLININNVITGSNNINLRKVNVKSYGFDKMYVDKD